MKKIPAAFLILLFLLAACPVLGAGEVPSRIREVVLFSDQAMVTRVAELEVPQGMSEIRLSLDAFRVDPDSVTAKVFGEGQILAVQYKEIPVAEPVQDKIRTLETEIRDLRRKERALIDEKEVLAKKEAFLKSVVDFAGVQVPRDLKTSFPKMEDLQGALAFLGTRFDELTKKRAALDGELDDLARKIKALEEELGTIRRPARKVRKVIEVLFQGTKSQKIRVEAGYLVRNAFWGPLYRVSVPLALDAVDLAMFSTILQKTGEDWNGVDLSVSNVVPLKGVGIPEIAPWILDIPRPPAAGEAKGLYLDRRMKATAPMAAVKEEAEAPAEEAGFAEAERSESALSFEYRFPRPVDVESRDKETLLPLLTRKVEGSFFHLAVPRENPLTFLVCRAKGDGEILAGPMNVYFGGRYVGKTLLKEKQPGEAFDFNLGADREVKVTRTKTSDKVRETYFGRVERGTVVRELAYAIRMENLKRKPVTLRVLDAVPVSRTDRLEVKDVRLSPEPKEKNHQDREGVDLWEFELKPGEMKEISIGFVVTYPRETPPIGL